MATGSKGQVHTYKGQVRSSNGVKVINVAKPVGGVELVPVNGMKVVDEVKPADEQTSCRCC